MTSFVWTRREEARDRQRTWDAQGLLTQETSQLSNGLIPSQSADLWLCNLQLVDTGHALAQSSA